jgi:hypothetical protein
MFYLLLNGGLRTYICIYGVKNMSLISYLGFWSMPFSSSQLFRLESVGIGWKVENHEYIFQDCEEKQNSCHAFVMESCLGSNSFLSFHYTRAMIINSFMSGKDYLHTREADGIRIVEFYYYE